MSNRKATLVRLCKTEKGWRRYPVVIGKNGRVRPNFVWVAGKQREYPDGRYQLRMYEGSRMFYRDAGDHPADALTEQIKAEHVLSAKAEARAGGVRVEEDFLGRVSLYRGLSRFVQAAKDRGADSAASVYEKHCRDFLRTVGRTYADEITPEDVLRQQRELREQSKSPRTVYNRHRSVLSFLRFLG